MNYLTFAPLLALSLLVLAPEGCAQANPLPSGPYNLNDSHNNTTGSASASTHPQTGQPQLDAKYQPPGNPPPPAVVTPTMSWDSNTGTYLDIIENPQWRFSHGTLEDGTKWYRLEQVRQGAWATVSSGTYGPTP